MFLIVYLVAALQSENGSVYKYEFPDAISCDRLILDISKRYNIVENINDNTYFLCIDDNTWKYTTHDKTIYVKKLN